MHVMDKLEQVNRVPITILTQSLIEDLVQNREC